MGRRVYAVDVGHGQLWGLRTDDRVVVMEKTNARHLTADDIPDVIDLVVCDASFISLKKVLPASMALTVGAGCWRRSSNLNSKSAALMWAKAVLFVTLNFIRRCKMILPLGLMTTWGGVSAVLSHAITGPEGNKEFIIIADKPAD